MGWSGYTIVGLISFIIGVACLFFPRIPGKERALAFFSGAGVFAWELYVTTKTQGTFSFSVAFALVPAAIAVRAMLGLGGEGEQRAAAPAAYGGTGYAGTAFGGTAQPARAAMGAGLLRDGAVVRALESYGRRELAGQSGWAPETTVLQSLRDAISASKGTMAAGQIHDGLLALAKSGPLYAVGVWRFCARYGLPNWRHGVLPRLFLDALRQILMDPSRSVIAYRFDDFESDMVRQREPRDSRLWSLVPPRAADLEPQEPPAVGAEPPVADLADGEQRLIARLGSNRLVVTREDGAYVVTLVPAPDESGVAQSRTYVRADSLMGTLRETGLRLRASAAVVVVSDDLVPYLPLRRPAWWPTEPLDIAPAPPAEAQPPAV
jgi:hypothetical protein